VTIGFIVIFQAMYTAVMERTREIGILKSMGASKGYIVALILRETTALAVAGIILGTVLSLVAGFSIHARVPVLPMEVFNLGWIGKTTLIAIVGALGGAVYPAFKAAQKDPIDALAYD
jgi:putative ABC transport system permease protein